MCTSGNMAARITLSNSVGSGLRKPGGLVLCCGIALLAACQQLGRTVGPPAPKIGVLPAATHEMRATLSGTKSPGSAITVDGFQRVPVNNSTIWTAAVDLTVEGTNTIVLEAMDDLGNLSESLIVRIERDTADPAPPTISTPAMSPTTSVSNPFTIAGTKEAGTFIRLNGRRIIEASNATAWTYQTTLSPPPPPPAPPANTLTLTAVDAAGNQDTTRVVSGTSAGSGGRRPRTI